MCGALRQACTASTLLASAALLACDVPFVGADRCGDEVEAVTFSAGDPIRITWEPDCDVDVLQVYNDQQEEVWALSGDGFGPLIEYGRVPPEVKETVPASALDPGRTYTVFLWMEEDVRTLVGRGSVLYQGP